MEGRQKRGYKGSERRDGWLGSQRRDRCVRGCHPGSGKGNQREREDQNHGIVHAHALQGVLPFQLCQFLREARCQGVLPLFLRQALALLLGRRRGGQPVDRGRVESPLDFFVLFFSLSRPRYASRRPPLSFLLYNLVVAPPPLPASIPPFPSSLLSLSVLKRTCPSTMAPPLGCDLLLAQFPSP